MAITELMVRILIYAQFSNLLGTVYSQGNLLFSPDGSCLFSPVGNRVTIFDLVKYAILLFSLAGSKLIRK